MWYISYAISDPAVYLSVTTEYIGCAANTSLVPNEVYILQMQERVIRLLREEMSLNAKQCKQTSINLGYVLIMHSTITGLIATLPDQTSTWSFHGDRVGWL